MKWTIQLNFESLDIKSSLLKKEVECEEIVESRDMNEKKPESWSGRTTQGD